MKINGTNGANTQMVQMGMNQAADSYSKNIQNQIANAQKQLQELSSNEDMTLEEKMKKRQEIQQQISDLNMQLRQHQIEQRKEKQQAKGSSMDDMLGGTGNTGSAKVGNKNTGLSQASMTAMISADTSIKQAKVQGSVAASMEGRANVLKAEVKQDGGNVEAKKKEIAELEQKAENATASQMNTLAEANKTMEEAAEAERNDNKASESKEEKTDRAENTTEKTAESGADGEKAQDGVSGVGVQAGAAENVQRDDGTQAENAQPVETAIPEAATAQAAVYTHVDVRL
ncbi:FlxA-like family protein [Parablautia intestinalis]|uniref:FlxA-like family protein n=1 Tax=Parablautia intestinalis TaxID=2320100 RepID=UPI00256F3DD1|nr:FlxA-like family protein [Parablautia intestinalis]